MSDFDVEKLPRRVAHATHAMLAAVRDLHMPVTAAEAMLYDAEALSPRGTAAALREASRRYGLAGYASGVWFPSAKAYTLAAKLEDRYLRDDERENNARALSPSQ